jgi:hypothetical protein
VVVNAVFQNVDSNYADLDTSIDQILSSGDLVANRFDLSLDNSSPFQYLSPATSAGSGVEYTGSLVDSIGNLAVPAGTDNWGTPSYDMIGICEQDGYYRTSDGTPYAIVEEFFSDRSTGEIHKYGFKTLLGPNVDNSLGDQFSAWRDAFQVGIIKLDSLAPLAVDDSIGTLLDTEVIISLLQNDSDPESDPLRIDGIVQPQHGRVFVNLDDSVSYIPDFDYIGIDTFRYWVTDGQGNYTPAQVTINTVDAGIIFVNGFDD